jgi:hypothetical protein
MSPQCRGILTNCPLDFDKQELGKSVAFLACAKTFDKAPPYTLVIALTRRREIITSSLPQVAATVAAKVNRVLKLSAFLNKAGAT